MNYKLFISGRAGFFGIFFFCLLMVAAYLIQSSAAESVAVAPAGAIAASRGKPFHGFVPPYLIARAELYANLHPQQPTTSHLSLPLSAPAGVSWQSVATQHPSSSKAVPKSHVLIYDARGSHYLPGFRGRFEHGEGADDPTVNRAYEYQLAMRLFLKKVFNRNSIDDQGADLVGTIHYGRLVNNATWNGRQMIYGDGDGVFFDSFVELDIVGHEIFHAVIDNTSKLNYYGQSGALNEHLSDVFGVLFRQWHSNLTVDKDTWLLGAGMFTAKINGRALRDMRFPGTAYNDPFMGKDSQPAHMTKFVYTSEDNGGVHDNSGIPNRAFALFALSVGGKAWKTAGHVWYEVATSGRMPKDCDFQTFANATVAACVKQAPKEVEKLKVAWAAVGIKVA